MKDFKHMKRSLGKSRIETFFSENSMTNLLILANIVFFVFVIIVLIFIPEFFNYIALKPSQILQYPWTLVTHMFMHAPGPSFFPFLSFHLFVNMFVLFSLGSLMERIIGKRRFFWFYLISGVLAGLLFVVLAFFFGNSQLGAKIFGSPDIAAVGASGAIFAIAGLFVVLLPRIRFSIIFFPFFSLPGYIMVPLVLVLMWIVSAGSGLPVGNTAHFGGFITGLIYGFYLRRKYKRKIAILNQMFG